MALTAFAASLAVNALVTGLIVFKILRVFLEVKATSIERTLGSLSSAGGSKLRHIIFVMIESGVMLFVIQLAHVTLVWFNDSLQAILNIISPINQMVNVSIRSVQLLLFFLLIPG